MFGLGFGTVVMQKILVSTVTSMEVGDLFKIGTAFFSPKDLWKKLENQGMVWVVRDPKAHLLPTPCCGQGRLSLARVAPGPVQPGLENAPFILCANRSLASAAATLYSRIICCPNSFLLKQLHFAWNN